MEAEKPPRDLEIARLGLTETLSQIVISKTMTTARRRLPCNGRACSGAGACGSLPCRRLAEHRLGSSTGQFRAMFIAEASAGISVARRPVHGCHHEEDGASVRAVEGSRQTATAALTRQP